MRTVLFALLGLIAVGCATPVEESFEESTQNLDARELSAFQPYKTVGGTCQGCRAYVDSLELSADEALGGRFGTYKKRHCPIEASTGAVMGERDCDVIEDGKYHVRAQMVGGQRQMSLVLTPNGSSTTTTLQIVDTEESTVPSLRGSDSTEYFGKGHVGLSRPAQPADV